jgi:alkanesulfonate monooxygenase SsuD/methylene tetrahydromethanopterin reductase-like flavin-dependent oxidoreductase (luciferase family)
MHIGLHLSNFTWPGGPATMASDLGRAAKLAEDVGFTKLSVMDHVWQIGIIGPPENDMLEAYTALGYIAAKTERIQLLAWVTGVPSYILPPPSRVLAVLADRSDLLLAEAAWTAAEMLVGVMVGLGRGGVC